MLRALRRARRLRRTSAEQADAQEDADRLEAVPPCDLLPLCVGAAVVGNRKLVNAQLPLADLRRDLRFDAEVVLAEVERAQDLRAESLIAGLHIRERGVVEDVRQQGQEAVPDEMPEQVHALRLAARQA